MGAFFTNLHVRGASTQAVSAALSKLTEGHAYVSPASNEWVTVYTEVTEDQDDEKLRDIAGGLSKTLKTDVIGFLVHDSDIAAYWLYTCGALTDEFNSAPDYFDEHVDAATRDRVSGNTDALLPLCVKGTTRKQLDEVLHPPDGPPTFAEEIVMELAKVLGIDAQRARLGFEYFVEEGGHLPDVAEFEAVGRGAARKAAPPQPPPPEEPGALSHDDTYPMAISVLTKIWNPGFQQNPQFTALFGNPMEGFMKQMFDASDRSARDLLKNSTLPNLPPFEELKTARDQGPEALADLIAKRTPDQLTEIGVGAARAGMERFVAALLKVGLNPTAPNAQGRTTLGAAEQQGKESAIYRLVKAAADGK